MRLKSNKTAQRLNTLLHREDNLETELGAWFPGERVVIRGKDLFDELADLPWFTLLVYNVTGRIINENQRQLMEGVWSLSVSYPDPRLWNNRVAALSGTTRSTASLGVSSAIAVTEAKIYGGQVNHGAMNFIKRALIIAQQNEDELNKFINSELQRSRFLPGYGRPLVAFDERIAPLMRLVTKLGFQNGEHIQLALKIERYLKNERQRLSLNITGVSAALLSDQALTTKQYSALASIAFNAGILPCYLDAVDKPEGGFFPLRCDRLRYRGTSPRNWD